MDGMFFSKLLLLFFMLKNRFFFFLSLKREEKRIVKSSPWNTIFGAFLLGIYLLQFHALENLHFFLVPKQLVVDIKWNIINLMKCIPSDWGGGPSRREPLKVQPVDRGRSQSGGHCLLWGPFGNWEHGFRNFDPSMSTFYFLWYFVFCFIW